MSLPLICADNR